MLVSAELYSALCLSARSWTQRCIIQHGDRLSTVFVSEELNSRLCYSAWSWTQHCVIQHGVKLSTVFVTAELDSSLYYSAQSWNQRSVCQRSLTRVSQFHFKKSFASKRNLAKQKQFRSVSLQFRETTTKSCAS